MRQHITWLIRALSTNTWGRRTTNILLGVSLVVCVLALLSTVTNLFQPSSANTFISVGLFSMVLVRALLVLVSQGDMASHKRLSAAAYLLILAAVPLVAAGTLSPIALALTLIMTTLTGGLGTSHSMTQLAAGAEQPGAPAQASGAATTVSRPVRQAAEPPAGKGCRELVEQLPAVIYTAALDQQNSMLYVSPQLEELLGCSPMEWIEKPDAWLHHIHPADRARVLSELTSSRGPGDRFVTEYRMLTHDGQTIWVHNQAEVIPDKSGKGPVLQGLMLDTTERAEAVAALRESAERDSLAIRGSNDGLWDWDLKRKRIHFSPRWKEMLGYAEHEIASTPEEWFSLIHPNDMPQFEKKLAAHLAGKTPHFEHEHRIRLRDGSYRWVLCRGLAVRDTDDSLLRMCGLQTDINVYRSIQEQLLRFALYDELTGLPNRGLFIERLERAVERAQKEEELLFAVLILDIDGFRTINDSLGSSAGDQLLVAVARRLESCLRLTDTVARMGGDEFAIMIEGVSDMDQLTRIVEHIEREVAQPFRIDDQEIFTNVSIGIALSSTGYTRADDLLRNADTALYRARTQGKARHELFDAGMRLQAVQRLRIENGLRRAADRGELGIEYQPIISLTSGRIIALEALMRWRHPELGAISPAEFIPIAEETGLIVHMGEWILRKACEQAVAWQAAGLPPVAMSVNLSARQLMGQNAGPLIAGILRETGLAPQYLQLELTESNLLEHASDTMSTLRELYEMGIELAIDDFGTGYSSLGYLKRFPLHTLKIDKIFVWDIRPGAQDKTLAAAIVAMGQSLSMRVIAEGVESADQLAFLREHGCNAAQGNFFSRPLPAHSVVALLDKRWSFAPRRSGEVHTCEKDKVRL